MMRRPGGQRPHGAMGGRARRPRERSKDFAGTLRRLLARLRPERVRLVVALFLGVTSVGFTVTGPKILGDATNVLFDGVVGKQLPAGVTKAQAIALLRAHGQGQLADMISAMNVTPGAGVDLTQLGQILGLAALVYLLGAAFNYGQGYIMAGVTQRTMFGLRREVEEKLARLPLRYFDSHPHGDILSRVTNDIDNLTTTLQQGLSQLLTSVLTIVGVLGMMFWISPLLAAVSVVTIPLAIVVTFLIARRSQVQFAAQWEQTGALNGLVEETHTGHALVQVFGRRQAGIDGVRPPEPAPVRGELPSPVPLRGHPAVDAVPRQHQLRRDRGARRLPGRLRRAVARRRAGVHPVLAPVHDADHPDRQPDEPAAVRAGLGRAGVRVPGRAGGVGRPCRPAADAPSGASRRARDARARLVPLRAGRAADRGLQPRRGARPDHRDRRPDRRGQDHHGQPARCASTRSTPAGSPSTAPTTAT